MAEWRGSAEQLAQRISLAAQTAKRGAIGNVKAMLAIDLADDQARASRMNICLSCESLRTLRFGKWTGHLCTAPGCGCLLESKTRLKQESCPKGKWSPATIDLSKTTPPIEDESEAGSKAVQTSPDPDNQTH